MEFPSRVRPIEETKCGLWYGRYMDIPTKKETEFPGVFKIDQLQAEFPWVFFFLNLEFPRMLHNFAEFPGVKTCFLQIFCDQWSYDTPHDSLIHGPLIVLYDVLYYYFITIKYVYIYLILFLFNSFYSISFILFSCLSGWNTYDTVWYEQLCWGCWC